MLGFVGSNYFDFFCMSCGALLSVVIAQCTSLWALSETIILFFESFVLPMHIRLYFGFFHLDLS